MHVGVQNVLDLVRGNKPRALTLDGQKSGSVRRTSKGVQIDLAEGAFADWVEAEAQDLITDLHTRWVQRSEDT